MNGSQSRTGIKERRISKTESTGDLATEGGKTTPGQGGYFC